MRLNRWVAKESNCSLGNPSAMTGHDNDGPSCVFFVIAPIWLPHHYTATHDQLSLVNYSFFIGFFLLFQKKTNKTATLRYECPTVNEQRNICAEPLFWSVRCYGNNTLDELGTDVVRVQSNCEDLAHSLTEPIYRTATIEMCRLLHSFSIMYRSFWSTCGLNECHRLFQCVSVCVCVHCPVHCTPTTARG